MPKFKHKGGGTAFVHNDITYNQGPDGLIDLPDSPKLIAVAESHGFVRVAEAVAAPQAPQGAPPQDISQWKRADLLGYCADHMIALPAKATVETLRELVVEHLNAVAVRNG